MGGAGRDQGVDKSVYDPDVRFQLRDWISADLRRSRPPVGQAGFSDRKQPLGSKRSACWHAGQPVCCRGVARLDESSAHAGDENIRTDDLVGYSKFMGLLLYSARDVGIHIKPVAIKYETASARSPSTEDAAMERWCAPSPDRAYLR